MIYNYLVPPLISAAARNKALNSAQILKISLLIINPHNSTRAGQEPRQNWGNWGTGSKDAIRAPVNGESPGLTWKKAICRWGRAGQSPQHSLDGFEFKSNSNLSLNRAVGAVRSPQVRPAPPAVRGTLLILWGASSPGWSPSLEGTKKEKCSLFLFGVCLAR